MSSWLGDAGDDESVSVSVVFPRFGSQAFRVKPAGRLHPCRVWSPMAGDAPAALWWVTAKTFKHLRL